MYLMAKNWLGRTRKVRFVLDCGTFLCLCVLLNPFHSTVLITLMIRFCTSDQDPLAHDDWQNVSVWRCWAIRLTDASAVPVWTITLSA